MQAAYGLFDPNDLEKSVVETALMDQNTSNFTETQAQEFVDRFNTISHIPNDGTGFSATLFRDTQNDGQAVLAIRGTEPQDFLNDLADADIHDIGGLGLAIKQAISLYNYVNSLRTGSQRQIAYRSYIGTEPPVGVQALYSQVYDAEAPVEYEYFYVEEITPIQGAGEIAEGEQIIVTGHSLGGHLAALASALFPDSVSDVYTYNAPGYDPISSLGLTSGAIRQITGDAGFTDFDESNIHSLVGESELGGDDLDVVSAIGTPFSSQIDIFIEVNTNGVDAGLAGHSKVQITDSLKLYDVFVSMDASLTLSDITSILHSGSNKAENSLESVTEALAQLFKIADHSISEYIDTNSLGARDKYHQVITAINTIVSNNTYSLKTIPSGSTADLASQNTETGRGYRYALVNLLPFAITSNLAGTAADDPQYDAANFSKPYLADRAHMLELLITRNTLDITTSDSLDENLDDALYIDQTTNLKLTTGAISLVGVTDSTNRIYFGDESTNVSVVGVESGKGDDRLYGMGGDDTLHGGEGSDHLEGNLGNDNLHGGEDRDYLYGGAGEDKLYGGKGNDTLSGGDDQDSDSYYYALGDGNDQIIDADLGGDRIMIDLGQGYIDLATLTFKPLTEGSNIYIANGEDGDSANDITLLYGGASLGGTSVIKPGQNQEVGSITLLNYSDGGFGINLQAAQPVEENMRTNAETLITHQDGQGLYQTNIADENMRAQFPGGLLYYSADYFTAEHVAEAYAYWQDNPMGTQDYDAQNFAGFVFQGSGANDFLYGGAIADGLFGLDGDDLIKGDDGVDLLHGGRGSDQLFGGEGNDTLFGAYGVDVINGVVVDLPGTHQDPNATDYFEGNAGLDYISGSRSIDHVSGGADRDVIGGGLNNDILSGDGGDDLILGDSVLVYDVAYNVGQGSESLYLDIFGDQDNSSGLGTDDIIDGGEGADVILGEYGNDTISGGAQGDIIFGDRNDQVSLVFQTLVSAFSYAFPMGFSVSLETNLSQLATEPTRHGNDIIDAGDGENYVEGNGGDDVITGGMDNDQIQGDDFALEGQYHGKDTVHGGAGVDTISGDGNDDRLFGDEGADIIDGDNAVLDGQYHGADEIHGGEGNDTIIGNGGADTIYGDAGDDSINGDANGLSLQYQGNDIVYGGAGADYIWGLGGNDKLFGGKDGDYLFGGDGNDLLEGGEGNDQLLGGEGDDTLTGGSGVDSLQGEAGNDRYIFSRGDGSNTVTDTLGQTTLIFNGAPSIAEIKIRQDAENTVVYYAGNSEDYVVLPNSSFINVTYFELAGGSTYDRRAFLSKTDFINSETNPTNITVNLGSATEDDISLFGRDNDLVVMLTQTNVETGLLETVNIEGWVNFDANLYGNAYFTDDSGAIVSPDVATGLHLIDWFANTTGTSITGISLNSGTYVLEESAISHTTTNSNTNEINGSVLNDNLIGTSINDLIYGNGGDDKLIGSGGVDYLYGGPGNDYLNGGWEHDFLYGEEGNDQLIGGGGEWDYLNGGAGDDILTSSSIVATLDGGSGNDRYVVNENNSRVNVLEEGGQDTIIFDKSFRYEDIYFSSGAYYDENLSINVKNTTVYVSNVFNPSKSENSTVETLITNGGDVHLFSDILNQIANNTAPTLEGFIPNFEVNLDKQENFLFQIASGLFVDHDSTDPLRYSVDQLGVGVELQNLNIDPFAGTISSTVFTPDTVGEYPILLRASDRFDGHSEPVFLLDIKSDRPEIDPRVGFEDQIVRAGDEFRFEIPYDPSIRYQGFEGSVHIGINYDPSWWDGGIPRYTPNGWSMEKFLTSLQNPDDLPAWLSFDTETHTLYGTPTANDSGQNFTIDILLSNHETFGFRHTVRIGVDKLVYPPITASSLPDHPMWDGQGFISVAQGSTHTTNTSTILESYKSSPNKQVAILGVRCLKNGNVTYDKQSGAISFTPNDNFTGVTSLTYTMWDGEHISEVNQGVIVLSLPEAITANDDDFGVPVDSQILIPFADLLENDIDAEGDTLRIVALGNVTNGQAYLNVMTEMVTFTPEEGYVGEATLEYFVSGGSDITMGKAHITIGSTVNTPPSVVDDMLEAAAGTAVVINATSLLANDSDVEGDSLIISNVLNAVNGEVVLDTQSGDIIFTPIDNYVGQASFEYEVSDGMDTSIGIVTIELTSSVGEVIDGTNGSDTIIGTTGNDVITGGLGDDSLFGGAGNDVFVVKQGDGYDHYDGGAGDDLILGSAGDDQINIRSLTDIETIDGGGGYNTLAIRYSSTDILDVSNITLLNIDELIGTGDHVTIIGTAGDDRINGGTGNDVLRGGEGNDIYKFAFGDGRDRINNYSENGIAETDTLLFEGLDYDSLWFSESGDNLIIDSLESNDRVIIDDWFSSPEFELDEIRVDTHLLLSSQVSQLVEAMASISAGEPASIENLTAQQQQDFSTAIAAAWQ